MTKQKVHPLSEHIDILPKIFGYNPSIEKYVNNIIIFNSKLQNNNILETVLKKKNIKNEILTIKHGTYKFFDSFFTIKQSLSNIIFNQFKLIIYCRNIFVKISK